MEEDSLSDVFSETLPIETRVIEDLPVQRPKRNKGQKSSYANKLNSTKVNKSDKQ